MSKTKKSDELLAQVYRQSQNPKELTFLNTVFDYLNRSGNFLSRPGVSKQVLNLVHKHIDDAKNKEIEIQKEKQKLKQKQLNKPKIVTKSISTNTQTQTHNHTESDEKDTSEKVSTSVGTSTSIGVGTNTVVPSVSKTKPSHPVIKEPNTEEEDGPIPVGNGGSTDKYTWTQSLAEVDVHFDVPGNLRGRHFNVVIRSKRLTVGIKGQKPIVDGELDAEILPEDCAWILDTEKGKSTKTLSINLQKKNQMSWWKRVMVGDAEINTKNIQPENSKLDNLDPETRQTVEKMMFDQRQKMMGKPTSKELEQNKILEQFKKQHPEMNFDNVKFG